MAWSPDDSSTCGSTPAAGPSPGNRKCRLEGSASDLDLLNQMLSGVSKLPDRAYRAGEGGPW